jgi:hypothetical protein
MLFLTCADRKGAADFAHTVETTPLSRLRLGASWKIRIRISWPKPDSLRPEVERKAPIKTMLPGAVKSSFHLNG